MGTLICPGCGDLLGKDEGQNRWLFWYGHAQECVEKNGMMPDAKLPKNPKQITLDKDAEAKAEAEPSLAKMKPTKHATKGKPAKRAKRAIRAKKAEQAKRAPQAKRAKRAPQAKLVGWSGKEKARRIAKDLIAKAMLEIEGD